MNNCPNVLTDRDFQSENAEIDLNNECFLSAFPLRGILSALSAFKIFLE